MRTTSVAPSVLHPLTVAIRRCVTVSTLMLTSFGAWAECTNVTANETINCTVGNNQSLTIASSGTLRGSVSMTGNAARMTVNGGGNYVVAGAAGILMTGVAQTLTNNGTMLAPSTIASNFIEPSSTGFVITNGATGVIDNRSLTDFANAIQVDAGGSGTINNAGRISASATTATAQGAIFLLNASGNVTLNNQVGGTISAPSTFAIHGTGAGPTSLRNAGTISTGVAGGAAISLGNGNDTVTLEPTSSIIGYVTGGGGTNTLAFGGTTSDGTFDVGGIGAAASYRGFQAFQKVESNTWTLTGTGTTATNWTDAGGLLRLGSSTLNIASINATGGNLAYANGVTSASAVTLNAPTNLIVDGTDSATQSGVVSGANALTKSGTGALVLSGANTYTGGTNLSQGTVQANADNALGAATGAVAFNGGTLRLGNSFDLAAGRAINVNAAGGTIDTQAFNSTIAQDINGGGRLTKTGAGTLTLAGSTYVSGTIIGAGTLQLGNGGTSGSLVGSSPVVDNGTLAFNRSDDAFFGSLVSGTGGVSQVGTGTTTLFGNNSYKGATSVTAGGLYINGDQTAATGATTVNAGTTLGGSGTVGGFVAIADGGTLAPGGNDPSPGTLTIKGDLGLVAGSVLSYSFGQANVPGGPLNDLTTVSGNLTLNVVVPPGGSFGPGVYRVLNYGGTLTDNGLALGTLPATDNYVQTSVANQVNLVNAAGLQLNYWDGAADPKNDSVVNGGNGTWQNAAGNDNWTDVAGTVNAPYADRSFAVFEATPGTVTVDNSLGNVSVAGMQFASNGYLVQGDPITLAGSVADPTQSIVRVGDGTTASAGYTATVNSVLTGASGLTKTDAGTLVLGGANTYTGNTAFNGGVVQIASDSNLGAATGGLSFDGGTLRTTADVTSNRAVTLNAGGGTVEPTGATTLTGGGVIGGAGGLTKQGTGTLTLTGDNTYTGVTMIGAGTLQLGSGGTGGSLAGAIVDNGTLAVNRSDVVTLAGAITGSGVVQQVGAGTTTLTGANTYTGGTTISAGTLQLGDGGTTGSLTGNVTDNGTLAFNRSDDVIFNGLIAGIGGVAQRGTGVTTLTGGNTYTGPTNVDAGSLYINGDQSAATGPTTVNADGTLGGTGTLGGPVGGTLSPGGNGPQPGTLNVNGTLAFNPNATLAYSFGQAGVPGGAFNDLTQVNGDLILDGTLNVNTAAGGTFDPGVYRVINYTGALTNNGLAIGTIPSPDFLVQTGVANQVNLVNTAGLALNVWDGQAGPKNDGVVNGGNGTWQNVAGNDNWTDANGVVNAPFADRSFAIFEATPGTVRVDNSLGNVNVAGMQFASTGYVVQGDPITLTGTVDPAQTIIRVGDGTLAGAGYTATINSVLTGALGLTKTDAGTLVLGGQNTYTGNTAINGGTLQVASNGNLGAPTGGLSFDGGTLRTTGDVASDRAVTLNAGGGTLAPDANTTLTLGAITGPGGLTQNGAGTTTLTGDSTYSGGTTIAAGTLQLGHGGTGGGIVGDVVDNGTLAFNRSDDVTFGGTVSGTGALQQRGTNTTTLTGNHTYTGGTTIAAGTLQLGNGGTSGSLVGDVTDNGTLAFNRSDDVTFGGVVSGTGAVLQRGTNTTTLTGNHTYTGGTTISAGTLQLGNGGTSGSLVGDVLDNGALVVNRSDAVTVPGVISGTGSLSQVGAGTTTLEGNNTYTGGTTITAGTLQLGSGGTTGNLVGDVTDNGTLAFNRADRLNFDGTISGNGTLEQRGNGTTVLNGTHSYTGTTTVAAGTLAIGDASHSGAALTGGGATTVASGATLGGYGAVAGAVTNAGTLAVADAVPAFAGGGQGNFTVGNLTNRGWVQLGGTGAGNTLTATDYTGQNGRIALNAVLAGDGSPSDRVVINGGRASGTSSLEVNNAGGGGALTPGNGILVVDAINGGTTDTGAFALGRRAVAGPYEYALYRGARDGSAPDDWYLRTDAGGTGNPPPGTPGGSDVPNYRREVSDYTALSSMMADVNRSILGTLHERVGDEASLGKDGDNPEGVWGRVIGQNGKWNAKSGGIYRDGPSYDANFVAAHVGADLFHETRADGSSNRAGLYGAAGHGYGGVTHYDGSHAWENRFDTYSLGAYWTHYTANDAYLDTVLQGTWYTNVKSGSRQLGEVTPDAFAFAASVEGGYPFQLSNRWLLEPQAQLIYQGISVDTARDTAADIRFGNVDSVAGRAGARLARTWTLDDGAHPRQLTTWLRGNVWHEFSANPKTEVSSDAGFVPFHSNLKGTWYEVTAGVSAQLSKATSVYANLGYEKGFNNGVQAVNGTVGVRVNW